MNHHGRNNQGPIDVEEYIDDAQRRSERGNWWEMPAVLLLVCISGWIFLSGNRIFGLIAIWTIAVAILLLEQTGKAWLAMLTLVIAMAMTVAYILVFFQSV